VPEFARMSKVTWQNGVVADFFRKMPKHGGGYNRNIAKGPAVGPADSGLLRQQTFGLRVDRLFIADLAQIDFACRRPFVILPLAPPEFHRMVRSVDAPLNEHTKPLP
jgi:hypothetical protein